MEDTKIVELFFARDEKALSETQSKYGPFCRNIAWNLLLNREDAEECVNDTMHAAWNTIPPTRPHSLRAYLGGITRKLALMCFRKRTAKKRDGGIALSLEELSEVIPSAQDVERNYRSTSTSGSAHWTPNRECFSCGGIGSEIRSWIWQRRRGCRRTPCRSSCLCFEEN